MMTKNRLTISVAAASLLTLCASGIPAAGVQGQQPEKAYSPASPQQTETRKGLLDGKFFKGEMGREGQASGEAYSVMFHGGMMHAHTAAATGSAGTAYTATENDGVVTFTATTNDSKLGKLEWQGTVTGENLVATVTTTVEGQPPQMMWVKAKQGTMPPHQGKYQPQAKGHPEAPATPPKTK